MTKTTFIYALTCPDTGEVRYVGKANNPKARLYGHLANHESCSVNKKKWIKSLLDSGKRPGLVILEEVPFTEWEEAEKRWIKYYRSANEGLTNISNGGGGSSGSIGSSDGKPATTPIRCNGEDIPELTQLRLNLSAMRGHDVSTADTIRWLLATDEAQRVIAAAHPAGRRASKGEQ